MSTIKEKNNLLYYTGAHPEIRLLCRGKSRPVDFGNKVWATSFVLIDYLESRPFPLENLKVLEIGCGWGLLGVYLAKNFNCQVTCSDLDPNVLPIVDLHADLNKVIIQTRQAAFSDLDSTFLKNFDLIIGSEVCYSEEVVQDILVLMENSFTSGVEKILIGDPGRPDFEDCYRSCAKRFSTYLETLPGTINGKSTQLLVATKRELTKIRFNELLFKQKKVILFKCNK